MERLEQRVNAIEQLPARIDDLGVQILQLREEMSVEFSAVRNGISAGDEETRRTLRDEIRAGDERVIETLSARIEDARRETRVLHEDAIGRIGVIGEGLEAMSQKVDRLDTKVSQSVDQLDALSHRADRTETTLSQRMDRTTRSSI